MWPVLNSGQLANYVASTVQWSASKLSDHLYSELRKTGEAQTQEVTLINQGFYGNQKVCVRYLSSITLCRQTFCYSFMVMSGNDGCSDGPSAREAKRTAFCCETRI